jgi:hypothetical protein
MKALLIGLLAVFGIASCLSESALAYLSEQQNGLCAICGLPEEHVDHDHVTGQVRGLLCAGCNKGLGFFRDSPQLLRQAAEYLEEVG